LVYLKSIKPGRGPSALGGFAGIIVAVFGIFWTIMAISMGAPILFALFGVFFVIMAAAQAVYNIKNATGRNRMSLYDITDENEEIDPIEKYIKPRETNMENSSNMYYETENARYCPYCGKALKDDFEYCPKCGKYIKNI